MNKENKEQNKESVEFLLRTLNLNHIINKFSNQNDSKNSSILDSNYAEGKENFMEMENCNENSLNPQNYNSSKVISVIENDNHNEVSEENYSNNFEMGDSEQFIEMENSIKEDLLPKENK